MKKLMLVVAMLSMAGLVAVPAVAQDALPKLELFSSGPPDEETVPNTPEQVDPPVVDPISPALPTPSLEVDPLIDPGPVEDSGPGPVGDNDPGPVGDNDPGPVKDSDPVPVEDSGPVGDTGPGPVGDTDLVEDSGLVKDTGAGPVGDTSVGDEDTGDDTAEDTNEDDAVDTGDEEDEDAGSDEDEASGDDEATDGDSKDADDEDADGKGADGKEKDGSVDQDSDQDADSGDVDQDLDIINTGDNVNLCIGIIQAVNTGNIQDSDQIAQEDSEAEEVELEDGSSITVTPQLIVDCRQIIYQIVTGEDSDGSKDKVSKTRASKLAKTKIDLKSTYFRNSVRNSSGSQPGVRTASGGSQPGVRTAGAGTRVISNRADARAAQQPNASRRALPRTGGIPLGYAAILGLSVGAPLVGGGLLLRRISR